MENNIFIGPFRKELFDYYNYKISLGYKFKSQLVQLKFFDNYTYEKYKDKTEISKEIVCGFIEHTNSNKNTKSAYASLLRQFAIYLTHNEIVAYIIPERIYTRTNRHIPYIFTDEEIERIFKSLEKYNFQIEFRKDIIIILFKLLYCTGMRISEVLDICVTDINFVERTLIIHKTKNNAERVIAINEKLCNELSIIIKKYHNSIIKDYIFIRNDGKRYNGRDIYALFRKILYYAKVRRTKNGPRLHDFRFTFCTKCLKKLIEEGKDINSYLPILSAYMGHKDFKSTEYYLTLTADVYPNIREKLEKHSKNIIRNIDWSEFND